MPELVLADVLAHAYLAWWAAQIIAILILGFLVVRWRPGFLGGRTIGQSFGAALDAREAQIKTQLEAAERSRQEAARIRQEAERDVERAHQDADDIVSRATTTSAAIQKEIEERAHEEYQRIVGQARVQIDYERQQAEQALRRRAADIAVDAAGQILRRYHDPSTDRRLIENSLSDMKDLQ